MCLCYFKRGKFLLSGFCTTPVEKKCQTTKGGGGELGKQWEKLSSAELMHSETFVSPEQKSSRHDLFCRRKRSASPYCASTLLFFFSAAEWQLIHNNSPKECKQGDMWHFQPFYCIITFSSVLKACRCRRRIFWDCAILSPVLTFLKSWCGIRITSSMF